MTTHRIQQQLHKAVDSLDSYKRKQYDSISSLISFNRDLLEAYSNTHALLGTQYIHEKLTEFQNIFVSYLLTSKTKLEVDNYKEVVEKFIITLMNDHSINIDELLCNRNTVS